MSSGIRLFFSLMLAAQFLSACGQSGSEGAGQKPAPSKPGPVASDENIYRCSSHQAETLVKNCIIDGRSQALGEEISSWTPEIGSWLSLQFQTRYIREKFKLTESEIQCLITTFCKEKLP